MQNRNRPRWLKVTVFMTGLFILPWILPNGVVAQNQATTPPAAVKAGGQAPLQMKLNRLVIDKVSFNKEDILDVISFLQKKSAELDPDKQGVNFVVSRDFKPEDHIHREVSLSLESTSLAGILDAVCRQANLQYKVEDYAVYVSAEVDRSEVLSVRTFLVPPGFFTKDTTSKSNNADVKNDLIARGIRFDDGATATFIPVSDKLVVRNTPAQLDLIAALCEIEAK